MVAEPESRRQPSGSVVLSVTSRDFDAFSLTNTQTQVQLHASSYPE